MKSLILSLFVLSAAFAEPEADPLMMVRYENGAVTPADTPAVQAAKAQHFAAHAQAYSFLGAVRPPPNFAPTAYSPFRGPDGLNSLNGFRGYNGFYGFNRFNGFNPYFNQANRFMRYKRDAEAQAPTGAFAGLGAYGAYPYGTYGAYPYRTYGAYPYGTYGAYPSTYGAYGSFPYNAYGAYGPYGAHAAYGAHGVYGAPRLYKKEAEADAQAVRYPYGAYGAQYTLPYSPYASPYAYGASIYNNRFYNGYNRYNIYNRGMNGYYPYAY